MRCNIRSTRTTRSSGGSRERSGELSDYGRSSRTSSGDHPTPRRLHRFTRSGLARICGRAADDLLRRTSPLHDAYTTLVEQAAAVGFSLVSNHPFVDGNKRVGLLAMDVFLRINDHALSADDDDAEATILALAAGTLTREELTAWVRDHVVPRPLS
ncbi:type II toxin-antitoxin system death-on-curing family toxin [Alienimonas sp. DA493]|uniref:type II toxin-antitoxin system death-on-curing family toxin n=1 Tax=Alienimonas sp. DA493 TaxID=3373605 RepID=UPI0037549C4B